MFKTVIDLSGINIREQFTLVPDKGTGGHNLMLQGNHTRPQMRDKFSPTGIFLDGTDWCTYLVSNNNVGQFEIRPGRLLGDGVPRAGPASTRSVASDVAHENLPFGKKGPYEKLEAADTGRQRTDLEALRSGFQITFL